ncbi:unnamed protein product [Paramecium sonneborni]|uniref:Uncharacterized protein n=1 Tax=Paramecium sonneborni TaxID=65129 RepID=A0A8S1QZV1_9CILI|nr:unnamed protein product [Paramecium sonneborni]
MLWIILLLTYYQRRKVNNNKKQSLRKIIINQCLLGICHLILILKKQKSEKQLKSNQGSSKEILEKVLDMCALLSIYFKKALQAQTIEIKGRELRIKRAAETTKREAQEFNNGKNTFKCIMLFFRSYNLFNGFLYNTPSIFRLCYNLLVQNMNL